MLILLLALSFGEARAQLADFTLTVEETDETCEGNGTLSFNVSGATGGSEILYTVYKLPNEVNPVYSGYSDFLDGRDAGEYKVVAQQMLGTQSNTQEVTVTIEDLTTPLTYEAVATTQNCQEGGQVVINTLTGTAVAYEIISPITVPLQDSNVFTGLPEGTYNFRVINDCGDGIVRTFTISYDSQPPVVSQPIYTANSSGDCSVVTITNTITYPETTAISYPLTIEYVIHPADGSADIITTQVFESGAPSFLEFSDEFPVVEGEPYTYDVIITNSCGITYGNEGMVVNPVPAVSLSAIPLPCGEYYLGVSASDFSGSYTLEFIDPPAGFDPVQFNPQALGEFNEPGVLFGSESMPVPVGIYEVLLTDACNRTAVGSVEITDELLPPVVNNGRVTCTTGLGQIIISFPDRAIVSATITGAPEGFAVPQDVSSSINSSGRLVLASLPVGTYIITITDECGRVYEDIEAVVLDFEEREFVAEAGADCTPGSGTARVYSRNAQLESVFIIDAPDEFEEELPFDVTGLIAQNGNLFIDGLPLGDYVFSGTDACGFEKEVALSIADDTAPITDDTVIFQPHCSSFDVGLADAASDLDTATYWLQKENEDNPGEWGHPATGAAYTEGEMPEQENALPLQNNTVNVNLFFTGHFRVLRVFTTYGSGVQRKTCITVLEDFEYYDRAEIDNVYLISCSEDGSSTLPDVYIDAIGPEPLQYSIISINGTVVDIDNGTNNIFTGLTTATYTFQVTDGCGSFRRLVVDISQLPNLAEAHEPDDILICTEPDMPQQQEFDLSQFNTQILGPQQSPDVYTVSYYATAEDAENLTNPLPYNYSNQSNPQTIYAAVQHNLIQLCHATTQFTVQFSDNPAVSPQEEATLCGNVGELQLVASAGFDEYEWSSGETTPSITVTAPGEYTVTVRKYYGDQYCEASTAFMVSPSNEPEITDVLISDWTEHDNSITVVTAGEEANFEYSLNGITYQDSPVFSGLDTGVYTVFVRDVAGCGIISREVALLNYPKFFTPNGDGHHEYWRIANSWLEQGMMLYIYDRYGKLISSFTAQDQGWDGTFHGSAMPSTDYWFVVNRRDGRVFKGHFSLIR